MQLIACLIAIDCLQVLSDTSLGKDARKKRAQGLKRMGELFLEAASADGKDGEGKAKTLRERLKDFLPPEAAAGASSSTDGAKGGDDDDDDDDDDVPDLGDPSEKAAAKPEPPPAVVAGEIDREALLAMSIKELRAIMQAQGLSTDGLLEKTEFVDAICAHAVAPPS